MLSDVPTEIGSAAGEVYRYLRQNGQVSLSQLRRDVALSRGRVDQAIGWLAREQKLEFIQDKRTTFIGIRDTRL